MTGTILSGSVSLGDNVEIPALKVSLIFTPPGFPGRKRHSTKRRVFSSNLKLFNYFQCLSVWVFLYSTISQLIIGDIKIFK